MRVKEYFTIADRVRFIAEAQSEGETLLHDEERDGVATLVFDLLPLVLPVPPSELDLLFQALRREDLSLSEVNQVLRLQQGWELEDIA